MKEYRLVDFLAVLQKQWGLDDLHTSGEALVQAQDHYNDAKRNINRILERGDGIAVYENQDMSSAMLGHMKLVSFGSPAAQLESEHCPRCYGDIVASDRTTAHCENSACSGHTPGLPIEEVGNPPSRLPDIGNEINWRYQLVGTYRGERL